MGDSLTFDYQLVHSVYEGLFDENVFKVVAGLKLLCCSLLLVHFYIKFFASTADKEKTLRPLTPWDIFKGSAILLAVISYDYILAGLDMLLGAIEGEYRALATDPKLGVLESMSTDGLMDEKPSSADTATINIAATLANFFSSPAILLLKLVETIAAFIDLVMYGVFLAERFFFMGLLRVIGAIAIACAVIEKLERWFWNWLAAYTVFWLLAIPLMLANLFTNRLYEILETVMPVGIPSAADAGNLIKIVAVFFIVWVKLRVYAKSHSILFKVFN